jgi:predicted Zn-dependent peptidase
LKIAKLNRKIAPATHAVTSLILPLPSVTQLDNGIPVYETRLGTQPVLKLSIAFPKAGRPDEHKRAVARAALRLTREGTPTYTSAQIAEILDFYAGSLSFPHSLDTSGLTLHCLTKHFEPLLALIAEMILQPTYPEQELKTFVDNNIQRLNVDLHENDTLAYRKISQLIFTENHPYGYNTQVSDYAALTREDLCQFHSEHLTADNCMIFIAGDTNEHILNLVNQYLGKHHTKKSRWITPLSKENGLPEKAHVISPNPEMLQTSVYIGRKLFTRLHEDFAGMYVLNTVLGGYFGSRLMSNIREDKGFTYGINSSIDLMHHDGWMFISADVGREVVDATLTEIHREMDILRYELMPESELQLVKNYLLGNLLNVIDGPLAVSGTIERLVIQNLPLSKFDDLIKEIQGVSIIDIQRLAQKYLNHSDWWQVTAGA